jgi:hypothetical protein
MRRGHEQDLIKSCLLLTTLGQSQVSPVDRIEGSAKHADSHEFQHAWTPGPVKYRPADASNGRAVRVFARNWAAAKLS